MVGSPDRGEVIELLEKLGGSEDVGVLEAARELNAKISGSGLSWDDLLVPKEDETAVETSYDEDDSLEDEDDAEASDVAVEIVATGEAAEDIKLIEQLLARKEISGPLREELDGYKEDIAEGDFTTADRQYLQALQNRLSGGSKAKSKN